MEVSRTITINFNYEDRKAILDTIEHILEPKRVGYKQYIDLRPEDVQRLEKLKKGLNAFEKIE